MKDELLKTALILHEAAQPVIAVREDKSPYRSHWNEYFSRRQTEDEVRDQFSNGAWGLARVLYPASEYVILDFDGEHSFDVWRDITGITLPDTARIFTPNEPGEHRIFLASPLLRKSGIRRKVRTVEANCQCIKDDRVVPCGVDLLLNGYAVIPPSPGYREDPNWPLESAVVLPNAVVEFVITKQAKTVHILDGKIPAGRRNQTLTSHAGVLRRQGKQYDKILSALIKKNETTCEPPLDEHEVETIARSIMRYEPAEARQVDHHDDDEFVFCPMTARDFLNEETTPLVYVLDDYVPLGALVVFVGYMKTGKSTWAYHLALAVARGQQFMGRNVEQGAVLLLAVEEHKRDVKRRLQEKLGMTEDDPIYILAGQLQNSPGIIKAIRKFVVEKNIRLVIIDSLSRFWTVQDENNNAEIVREMSPLLDLAHEIDVAILPLHHERKSGGDDGRSIRGGSALFGLVDQALFLERQPGERSNRRVLKALGRYDSPPELVIGLEDGEYKVLGIPSEFEPAHRIEKVRKAVDKTPRSALSIAQIAGVSDNETRKILNRLVDEKEIIKSGDGKSGHPYFYHRLVPV